MRKGPWRLVLALAAIVGLMIWMRRAPVPKPLVLALASASAAAASSPAASALQSPQAPQEQGALLKRWREEPAELERSRRATDAVRAELAAARAQRNAARDEVRANDAKAVAPAS